MASSARHERRRATKRPAPCARLACDDQGLAEVEHEREEYIYIKYKEDGIEEVVPAGYLRPSKDGWQSYHAASKAWFEADVIERNESKKDLLERKKAESLRQKTLQKEKVQEEKEKAKEKKEKVQQEKEKAKERKEKVQQEKEKAKEKKEKAKEEKALAKEKKVKEKEDKERAKAILEARDQLILDQMANYQSYDLDVPEAVASPQTTLEGRILERLEEHETMEEEVPMEEDEDDYHHTRPLPGTFSKPARQFQPRPASLIQTTPARPTLTTPARLIPTAPARLTPTAPARLTPTAPARPIQTTPAQPAQTTSSRSTCAQCIVYKAKIAELERRSELAIESSACPKSGKMTKNMAAEHNMVEVSPGTGVFTFEHNLSAALQKKSATFAATFLLSFFYSKAELLEHGYSGLDHQVLASIIAFASNAKGGRVVEIRQAIRSKMEGLKFRSKKKCMAVKSP